LLQLLRLLLLHQCCQQRLALLLGRHRRLLHLLLLQLLRLLHLLLLQRSNNSLQIDCRRRRLF